MTQLSNAVGHRRTRRAWLVLALPGLVLVGADGARAGAPTQAPSPAAPAPSRQSADDSYVVVMEAEPVAAYDGGEPGLAPTDPPVGESVDPADPDVVNYVRFLTRDQTAALNESGLGTVVPSERFTYALSGFEATLSAEQAARLERSPRVSMVVPNELRQLHTDNTPDFLGLTAPGGPWSAGYTGEDVIVGVIDSGIWPEHASFADDGSYEHLSGTNDLQCDFGDPDSAEPDADFQCNDKLLGAYDMRRAYTRFIGPETYDSARDYDGHGTHTASTAAGNAGVQSEVFGIDRGTVSGIAHRARIIAYSACGNQGCFSSDLVLSIDKAVQNGVDVINYSIGGGPSLTGPEDLAFLFAADANVWVAVSNGNDGPGPETGGGPASVPWVTAVGASTHDRTFKGTARLEGGPTITGVSITDGTGRYRRLVDAEDLDNEICDPDVPFDGNVEGRVVLCLRGVVDRVAKSEAVANAGGVGMILYNPNDAQALVTDLHFVPSVHINYTNGLAVKAYIAAPGDARAWITRGVKAPAQGSVMADFSSRGPNTVAPDIIKPDITAPGVNVLAGHTPTPSAGAPGQLFQSISGTSMSSPHAAGLFALLRQAHPNWSAAMAKSAMMTTARQNVKKENGTTQADPFDMGAGHVDPSGSPSAAGSFFNPGIVYNAGFFNHLGFLCDADPSVFSDPEGTCTFLEDNGFPTEAHNLNYPSIGVSSVPGEITVQRKIRSVASSVRTFTASVQAPPGFQVTVSPSAPRLRPKQSRMVEITIRNVSAPVDAWRFGSLTWTSGAGHVARSPLAVKATRFEAPESVAGEGTAGSVSFPVTFGYTGPYDAAAHGPVAPTVLTGSVGQDPDQSFACGDTNLAGVTAVPITVTNTAHLRLALETADLDPPDPGIDIDLYLCDDEGDEVASSAAGSTLEQIDVSLPENGTYTLYVHGWQTGGATVDFGVRSWQVPLASGTGALEITEEPADAVSGETGTVEASWSGLDADREYLGAVSHSAGADLLALTLVEIDTTTAP